MSEATRMLIQHLRALGGEHRFARLCHECGQTWRHQRHDTRIGGDCLAVVRADHLYCIDWQGVGVRHRSCHSYRFTQGSSKAGLHNKPCHRPVSCCTDRTGMSINRLPLIRMFRAIGVVTT